MVRLLGICVALLGIASLVFGIVFVVMSCSAKAEVIDKIADEGFPMFKYDEALYPYLSVTGITAGVGEWDGNYIDAAEDIDAAMDAIDAARHKMVEPPAGVIGFMGLFADSTFPAELAPAPYTQTVDTLKLHEYSALLGFSGVLGTAQMGLGMASLIQFVGIVSLIVGVALMVTGLVVFKLARPSESVSPSTPSK